MKSCPRSSVCLALSHCFCVWRGFPQTLHFTIDLYITGLFLQTTAGYKGKFGQRVAVCLIQEFNNSVASRYHSSTTSLHFPTMGKTVCITKLGQSCSPRWCKSAMKVTEERSYTSITSVQAAHTCAVWCWLFTFEHTANIPSLRALLQAWCRFTHQLAVLWSCWPHVSKSILVKAWEAYLPTAHISECHSSGIIHGDIINISITVYTCHQNSKWNNHSLQLPG